MTGLYADMEREIISDIARRVQKTLRYTETAELQAQALRDQGFNTGKIQAEVRKMLNASPEYQRQLVDNTIEYKREVMEIIKETERKALEEGDNLIAYAGDMSFNDDMKAWEAHDIDLQKPSSISQITDAVKKQTEARFKNITKTTGFKNTTLGQTGLLNAFQREMDLAVMKVGTGGFSYTQAVKDCVHRLSQSGLRSVDYASGRSYELDSAVRMCVRTGLNQLAARIQEENVKTMDTPLVYVDAHAGSRPEHSVWQGQVYYYQKPVKGYDDFYRATDYGSPTGLMGINCYHHFWPYFEGDPLPEFTEPDPVVINGREYTYYEATQEMRKQERAIRAVTRELDATKSIGEDTRQLQAKLTAMRMNYRSFAREANINIRPSAIGKPVTSSMLKNSEGAYEKIWGNVARTPGSGEKVKFDPERSYKVTLLDYPQNILDIMSEKAREIAQLGSDNMYEYGVVIDIDTGDFSDIFTSKSDEYVMLPPEYVEGYSGRFTFLHNHTTSDGLSLGDANQLTYNQSMDSILAVTNHGDIYIAQTNGQKTDKYWEFECVDDIIQMRKDGKSDYEIEITLRDRVLKEYSKYGQQYDKG